MTNNLLNIDFDTFKLQTTKQLATYSVSYELTENWYCWYLVLITKKTINSILEFTNLIINLNTLTTLNYHYAINDASYLYQYDKVNRTYHYALIYNLTYQLTNHFSLFYNQKEIVFYFNTYKNNIDTFSTLALSFLTTKIYSHSELTTLLNQHQTFNFNHTLPYSFFTTKDQDYLYHEETMHSGLFFFDRLYTIKTSILIHLKYENKQTNINYYAIYFVPESEKYFLDSKEFFRNNLKQTFLVSHSNNYPILSSFKTPYFLTLLNTNNFFKDFKHTLSTLITNAKKITYHIVSTHFYQNKAQY